MPSDRQRYLPATALLESCFVRDGGSRLRLGWLGGAAGREYWVEQTWNGDVLELTVRYEQLDAPVALAGVDIHLDVELERPLHGTVIVDTRAPLADRPNVNRSPAPTAQIAEFVATLDWASPMVARQRAGGRIGVTADTDRPSELGALLRTEFGPGIDVSGDLAFQHDPQGTIQDRLRWRRYGLRL